MSDTHQQVYESATRVFRSCTYWELWDARKRFINALDSGNRDPAGNFLTWLPIDWLYLAWINAEMCRRIDQDPLVSASID